MRRAVFGWVVLLPLLLANGVARAEGAVPFPQWLDEFKKTALKEGIPATIIEDAFAGIEPDEQVVELDQKQPETRVTFSTYLKNTVTPRRIKKGRAMMHEHRAVLSKISKRYGVQPEYIVALWGIETDFGHYKGDFSVIQSVATLAYEGRRAEFFGRELMAALKVMQREKISSADLLGSWAGAMGDCQFMPSTYLNYAADGDGNGTRDVWHSKADIFASVANYLHGLGWNPAEGWGYRVKTPEDFTAEEADIKQAKAMKDLRKRGVHKMSGAALPNMVTPVYIIYPGTEEEGAYLVTSNYQALLQWNRSRYFATAVGMLADKLKDKKHD